MKVNRDIQNGFVKHIASLIDIEEMPDQGVAFTVPFPRPSGDIPRLMVSSTGEDEYEISEFGFCDDYLSCFGIDILNLDGEYRWCDEVKGVISRYGAIVCDDAFVRLDASGSNLFRRIEDMCFLISELCELRLLSEPVRFVIPTHIDRKVLSAVHAMEDELGSIWGRAVTEGMKNGIEAEDFDDAREKVAKIIDIKLDDYLNDTANEARDLMKRMVDKTLYQ